LCFNAGLWHRRYFSGIMIAKRLFIVSNRLPITIHDENGVQPASGGLITAINSYICKQDITAFEEVFWAGVPGCSASTWRSAATKIGSTAFTYLPVFVQGQQYDAYYNGFSNSVLWPLFHYFPSYAEYNVDSYNGYRQVNAHFAQTLLKVLRPHDTLWIHDYHLLPLAGLLRKEIPELTIGFFLHIPFPSYEIFRMMPKKWQEELLEGMLGADLVGFHTIDYAAHFLQSVLMILGFDNDRHLIRYNNRLIKVDVFPISIDFKKFNEAYHDQDVVSMRQDLLAKMNGRKIIFSVDRLDYTKGVHNRLKAYEYFLDQHPEYHGNIVFILVIVPSRDTISKYAERKKMIDGLISQINSKTGSIHWMPVIYQYNYLTFTEMVALFSACDLALITPLRDGMNLVAKEFVASRQDKKGVLVLSEMAGAVRELTDALTINPNDVVDMANKIKEGLEMPEAEQAARLEDMQKRIAGYDVQAWADDFMLELAQVKKRQQSFQIKFLDEYCRRDLYEAYRNSNNRLLLLDYDGTLVSFSNDPDKAGPGVELLDLLKELCHIPGNNVYVISGRSSTWLQNHFGQLPLNLVAEHGARHKWKDGDWITHLQTNNDWKEQVQNIMEIYVRRCANTFIEEKDFSMVWHYRKAGIEQGKLRASELMNDLHEYIHNRHLQVLMGNKIVEVRQSGINKGSFIKSIIDRDTFNYILAAGDDRTDEDMFRTLINRKDAYTIKVGPDASYAKYNLHTPQMVISLLEGIKRL
jgi:trehalose 6-phosphate synthase/phosphatase